MKRNDIIVVVPFYRKPIDVFEEVSIRQLSRVLAKYPICFAVPESSNFDITQYLENGCSVYMESFKDDYFKSRESYNELCLEEDFYRRFVKYRYLLIHQSDAFVFSDRLLEFASMGYDYIGAPIRNEIWANFHVGNGGLSLRKIRSVINVLKRKNEIMRGSHIQMEDVFFGYCGYSSYLSFSVPDEKTASAFSVQDDTCDAYRLIKRRGLPFGMHRGFEENYSFWKPVIESYGYSLPEIGKAHKHNCVATECLRREWAIVLWKYNSLQQNEKKDCNRFCGLDKNTKFAIWGCGAYGKDCRRLFKELGVRVEFIIDNAAETYSDTDCSVFKPTPGILTGHKVIIAVKNNTQSIVNQIYRDNLNPLAILFLPDICGNIIKYFRRKYSKIEKMASEVLLDTIEDDDLYRRLTEDFWHVV